jgi:ABC-type branched-subunit amino acid transport system permease subunit
VVDILVFLELIVIGFISMRESHHGNMVNVTKRSEEFYEVIGIPIKANKVLIINLGSKFIVKLKELLKKVFNYGVNSVSDEVVFI